MTFLSKQYDLPISTISTILNKQNQEKLQALYQNNLLQPNLKRIKRAKYDDLDQAVDLKRNSLKRMLSISYLVYVSSAFKTMQTRLNTSIINLMR
jgi:hypothetical protein